MECNTYQNMSNEPKTIRKNCQKLVPGPHDKWQVYRVISPPKLWCIGLNMMIVSLERESVNDFRNLFIIFSPIFWLNLVQYEKLLINLDFSFVIMIDCCQLIKQTKNDSKRLFLLLWHFQLVFMFIETQSLTWLSKICCFYFCFFQNNNSSIFSYHKVENNDNQDSSKAKFSVV